MARMSTNLSDWWIGRSRCNKRNRARGGIVGNDRLSHVLLHVRDVAEVPDGADALEKRSALDETRLGVVDEQGFVDVIGQLLFGGRRAVWQHAAGGRVLLWPRAGCHGQVEI